jgi:hypothetical protein
MTEEMPYMVLMGKPEGKTRSFGRPVRRLEDNIKTDLSRNRITWRELSSSLSEKGQVKTVTKLQFLYR